MHPHQQLIRHNNNLHADCHKRHEFCEEKEPQKPRPLWHPVKLALYAKVHIVGLVRQNIDIVNWISHSSQEWSPLIDKEFHQLITNWKKSFWHNVEIKSRSPYGDKARFKFQKTLPINGYVFSGIKVEIAANMGGNF